VSAQPLADSAASLIKKQTPVLRSQMRGVGKKMSNPNSQGDETVII
jgi:hypothetical protein